WFKKPEWPPYVLWWVKEGRYPTWTEGVERHEHLHDRGPTPFAFTFKAAFNSEGKAFSVDFASAKQIVKSAGIAIKP
ncbi:MAG: DUF3291 domain-containing protein, partial [Aestuariivirga sp.]